jgi:hypothetical protein
MTTLVYKVENSQVLTRQRVIEIDGEQGTLSTTRLVVELVPVGHNGGTITLDLAADTEGYDEGAEINVQFGGAA